MNFRIGQKVVTVSNGLKRKPEHTQIQIPIGTVCTIREIDTRAIGLHGMATIRLVEYVNEVQQTVIGPWELGYRPDCFRPIVERKTDISFAHEILRKATKPAPAVSMSLHQRGIEL